MSPAWQNDNNTSKQSADPAGWCGVTEGGIVGSRVPAAYCAGADNMVDTNTVIEGTVKFRDGKKVSRFLILYSMLIELSLYKYLLFKKLC